MAKTTTRFVCQECGAASPKWMGKCPECGAWNCMTEEIVRPAPTSLAAAIKRSADLPTGAPAASNAVSFMGAAQSRPRPITEVSPLAEQRTPTHISEFDRVLGGGVVPGSLVLIGGDPGVGKSTLLTQVAGNMARENGPTLYISGEESAEQIKMRAARLGSEHENLLLASETDVAQIANYVRQLRPHYLIVDSIQTMQVPEIDSAPGTVSQVRASCAALAALAKGLKTPIFLVGHVTKDGAIAGPRVLEHMVDTVLYFEGDRHLAYRLLRAVKNRFGSTDELGIFAMREEGLISVDNPSEVFLAERAAHGPGSTVTATVEGSRPLLVEIQALVAPAFAGAARRTTNGVDRDRVAMILAVLEKRIGLRLSDKDVYVNVVGGVEIDEPAADLAIALAVASSLTDLPVEPGAVFLGEIGLSGEVRGCSQMEKRLKEAARLGFTSAILPEKNVGRDTRNVGLTTRGVDTLKAAFQAALRPDGNAA
ncbi:MAG: DNA repair protein RadA [Capsulimonadales bacterium]|nr:DNA repair protein RadA [Capsulimonadales bacterium]